MTAAKEDIEQQFDTVTGYDFAIQKRLDPAIAIRKRCLHCVGGSYTEVDNCTANPPGVSHDASQCHLWPYRHGNGCDKSGKWEGRTVPSRLKSMRKECLLCMGNSSVAVAECDSTHCFLWPWRSGKTGRTLKPEHAQKLKATQFGKRNKRPQGTARNFTTASQDTKRMEIGI